MTTRKWRENRALRHTASQNLVMLWLGRPRPLVEGGRALSLPSRIDAWFEVFSLGTSVCSSLPATTPVVFTRLSPSTARTSTSTPHRLLAEAREEGRNARRV